MNTRFPNWASPSFDERGMTRWNWMCQHHANLKLGRFSDIGAFTYINARHGVRIGENAQVGSHCSIYSESSIDGKAGPVEIEDGACIGSHTTVMPGVRIGKGAIVGAHSFVTQDIPAGMIAYGVPCKPVRPVKAGAGDQA